METIRSEKERETPLAGIIVGQGVENVVETAEKNQWQSGMGKPLMYPKRYSQEGK